MRLILLIFIWNIIEKQEIIDSCVTPPILDSGYIVLRVLDSQILVVIGIYYFNWKNSKIIYFLLK